MPGGVGVLILVRDPQPRGVVSEESGQEIVRGHAARAREGQDLVDHGPEGVVLVELDQQREDGEADRDAARVRAVAQLQQALLGPLPGLCLLRGAQVGPVEAAVVRRQDLAPDAQVVQRAVEVRVPVERRLLHGAIDQEPELLEVAGRGEPRPVAQEEDDQHRVGIEIIGDLAPQAQPLLRQAARQAAVEDVDAALPRPAHALELALEELGEDQLVLAHAGAVRERIAEDQEPQAIRGLGRGVVAVAQAEAILGVGDALALGLLFDHALVPGRAPAPAGPELERDQGQGTRDQGQGALAEQLVQARRSRSARRAR